MKKSTERWLWTAYVVVLLGGAFGLAAWMGRQERTPAGVRRVNADFSNAFPWFQGIVIGMAVASLICTIWAVLRIRRASRPVPYSATDDKGRLFEVVLTPPGSVLAKWTLQCDGEPMMAYSTLRTARQGLRMWTRPLHIEVTVR